MLNKKGELTSAQIIGLILAIGGFLILIVFLTIFLDLGGQTDIEVCGFSVLTRATSPEAAQNLVPLKCTTTKYCLTLGEDCEQFAGEGGVKKVKLSNNHEKAARKIEEISANAMFDCWSMMGQGKLDIFGASEGSFADSLTTPFAESNIKPKCVICSRVALAEDLQQKPETLQQVNLNEYLKNTNVPGSDLTYLQTFTDKQVRSYPTEAKAEFNNWEEKTTDQMAFVFSQILVTDKDPAETAFEKGINTGIAVGGSLLVAPTGKVVGIKGTILATLISGGVSGGLAFFQAQENQQTAVTFCDEFTSTEEGRKGCSVITPLDYNNVAAINTLCKGGIEGNP